MMFCQNCGKKEATMYFKENVNGNVREMHLCPECAAQMGIGLSMPCFSSFWNEEPLFGGMGGMLTGERKCSRCGMTESELRNTGRVGCADCYERFSDLLLPYIRKLHGGAAHVGTAPQGQTETPEISLVDALKEKLQEAVASENYEEAAKLRDEIRRLEG